MKRQLDENDAFLMFGCEALGFNGVDVVRYRAKEALNQPYQYWITLVRKRERGPLDLDQLIHASGTLALATQHRWRRVHGVIAEAEELERTTTQLIYRVLLVPNWWRARLRRRCRTFVETSLREIVESVLENRAEPNGPDGLVALAPSAQLESPPRALDFNVFEKPGSFYQWSNTLEQATVDRLGSTVLRPFVVQYNESDADFVARLLEDEGISFFFEHVADGTVLRLTDWPGTSSLFAEDQAYPFDRTTGAPYGSEEVVRSLTRRRGMRPRGIALRDFDWERRQETEDVAPPDRSSSAEYFEFPARDKFAHGHPAAMMQERFAAAEREAEGIATLRTMEPGHHFVLHDHDQLMDSIESSHQIVRVETTAAQLDLDGTLVVDEEIGALAPHFSCRFGALPAEVRFRPPAATPRPRVDGVQTALVTAVVKPGEPLPEIEADAFGRVRVRFPWDQRKAPEGKSSHWIRVSQAWAGNHYGALFTPRVGHEVLVAFHQGDPDRPVIVGTVYNGLARPPHNPADKPTRSTIKTASSPDEDDRGFNELRFDDQRGSEEIFLHAEGNLTKHIKRDHSSSVGGAETHSVGKDRLDTVKGDEERSVEGSRSVTIEKQSSVTVLHGDQQVTVKEGAHRCEATLGDLVMNAGNVLEAKGETLALLRSPSVLVAIGGQASITMDTTHVEISSGAGASISLVGDTIVLHAKTIRLSATEKVTQDGKNIVVHGSAVTEIRGAPIKLNC